MDLSYQLFIVSTAQQFYAQEKAMNLPAIEHDLGLVSYVLFSLEQPANQPTLSKIRERAALNLRREFATHAKRPRAYARRTR